MRKHIVLFVSRVLVSRSSAAQSPRFSAPTLEELRRAAQLIPGDAPHELRVLRLNPFTVPLAGLVDGGTAERVQAAYPVYQVRFPTGWIMVDAAIGPELAAGSPTFVRTTYDTIQLALRDANLIVVTHEHHDHVGGAISSPYLASMREHTMLTRAQVTGLVERPNVPAIRLDSAAASTHFVVDYESLLPIAPGVVLIRAPGHTLGSQMVFIRLASGSELLLAGDVAWNMAGIATRQHKPAASTRSFGGEDRDAIAPQLEWLQAIADEGVTRACFTRRSTNNRGPCSRLVA